MSAPGRSISPAEGLGRPLVASTTRLDLDLDPLTVAGPDGLVWLRPDGWMAGRGTALRIDVPPASSPAEAAALVHAALRELDGGDGDRGAAPVRAFGAVPFLPGAPWSLVVPEVLAVRAADGSRWWTTVAAPGEPRPEPATAAAAPGPDPACFSVRAARPPGEWQRAVADATAAIRAGRAVKVVLAREVVVETDHPIDRTALAGKLGEAFPSCTVFGVDGLVGASPELLVSRHGDMVRSHPLAGTAPRSADPTTDARLAAGLLSSEKNRQEHQITIDRVHETLLPHCSYLDAEAEPSIVAVANVQHLGTLVEGRLSRPAPSALELALLLHPTPAVCGEPRAAALELIAELEGMDRGRYAGATGWVDAAGDGEWIVAIRSAELHGAVARIFAGNGIVADSDPEAELSETRAKLQAMLNALVRP